jgi:Rps23 Pro-64 3,4-dihydroxylase Tpa1-like proline 4-hydroxylase
VCDWKWFTHLKSVDAATYPASRKLLVILELTKHWEATYGGLFMLLDSSRTQTYRVLVPNPNTLIMVDVSGERGALPYSISEIARNVTSEQVSVHGWYGSDHP